MKRARSRCKREAGSRSRQVVKCVFLFTASMLVVTCMSAHLTLTDMESLRTGMSVEESKSALLLPPKHEFALDSIGNSVQVLVDTYVVASGTYSSNYFLAFADSGLLYWGYPHEFARSRDSLIRAIGEQAVLRMNELDAEAERLEREQRQQQEQKRKP